MSSVYLIGIEGRLIFKIGVAHHPKTRLCSLQSSNPDVLFLHYVKKFSTRSRAFAVERAVHAALNSQRLRGEWFSGDLQLAVDAISAACQVRKAPLRAARWKAPIHDNPQAPMMREAFARACSTVKSKRVLARRIRVSHQTIYNWDVVPAVRVLAVERATGVSRHELRPDIYPVD